MNNWLISNISYKITGFGSFNSCFIYKLNKQKMNSKLVDIVE